MRGKTDWRRWVRRQEDFCENVGSGISGVAVANGCRDKSEGTAVMRISEIGLVGFGNRGGGIAEWIPWERDAEGIFFGGVLPRRQWPMRVCDVRILGCWPRRGKVEEGGTGGG